MTSLPNLDQLPPEQLRALAAQLMQRVESLDQKVETMGKKIHRDQTLIEKLTHEIAQLKRFKFAKRSEQLSPDQVSLLDDLIDTDIAAIEAELEALKPAPASTEVRQKPKRTALPLRIPRHSDTQPTLIRTPVPRSFGQAVGAQRRRFALLV